MLASKLTPTDLELDTHAVKGHFNPPAGQFGALGGVFVEDRVGVVNVDQDFALAGQLLKHFEHATGAVLCQMTHFAPGASSDSAALHFVVIPQGAVHQ